MWRMMYLLLCYNSQGNSLYVTLVTIDKLVETYHSHTRDWDTTPALDSLQEIRASKIVLLIMLLMVMMMKLIMMMMILRT